MFVSPRWIMLGSIALVLLVVAALWRYTDLETMTHPERLAGLFEPYRDRWIAFPITIAAFVLLELLFFPVLVLILTCGIAFGPWLGTLYAIVGSLTSAVVAFAIGRRLGLRRFERWGGAPARKLAAVLSRRGLIAVFLVRKVPAPFTLVNMACGASAVSLRDFVLGTVLGMGIGIVMLAALGTHLTGLIRDPNARSIGLAILILTVPFVVALFLQKAINRRLAKRGEAIATEDGSV